jgi:hypothetical protein
VGYVNWRARWKIEMISERRRRTKPLMIADLQISDLRFKIAQEPESFAQQLLRSSGFCAQ